ncbi:four helix bundle protein [Bacillus altitudinis]|uniref:four helix bundle protein n=1 Tax=Bacillus altitudinis TaxID=293387 RepID=UPI0032EB38B0
MLFLFIKDHHRIHNTPKRDFGNLFISEGVEEWINSTWNKYQVNLLTFASDYVSRFFENEESWDVKHRIRGKVSGRKYEYDYKQKNSLFNINSLHRKVSHKPFTRGEKQSIGYKKAKELEERIIELCKNFPSFEVDHIVNQIERSAESIKERIQIGEQLYIREKFNQYSIAIGSAKETSAWLQVSLGQKYITQIQFEELDNMVNQVVRILTKTLFNIKEKEGKGLDLPNPFTPDVKNFGAYNNALLLVERIYEVTIRKEFWKEKDLVSKMRKHATSCMANVAEAHQLHIKKKFRFFNDSLKALRGLESALETSVSKGIISDESLKEVDEIRLSIRNVLSTNMKRISDEKAS